MDSGEFESPTRRCWIVSWNLENKTILGNFTFSSLLFAALFQVWNRNYHCYLQNIIHPGSESSVEDADYSRLLSCFDIVDHKKSLDLNGSSVADIKPKRTLKSRMGSHFSPIVPSAIKSVRHNLMPWYIYLQHAYVLYLLVVHVLNMSFKQNFASTVTKTIKNSYRRAVGNPSRWNLS